MSKKVTVYVNATHAIEAGKTSWGHMPVDLSEILALLSEVERKGLSVGDAGKLTQHTKGVAVVSPEIAVIVETIKKTHREWVNAANRNLMNIEKILTDMEQGKNRGAITPDGKRQDRLSTWTINLAAKTAGVPGAQYEARAVALAHALERQNTIDWTTWLKNWTKTGNTEQVPYPKYQNQMDEAEIRNKAKEYDVGEVLAVIDLNAETRRQKEIIRVETCRKEKEDRAEANESSKNIWLAWAKIHGSQNLRYAIQEGYPLGQRVEREVVAEAMVGCGEAKECVKDDKVTDLGDRTVPNFAARDLLDRLHKAIVDRRDAPCPLKPTVGRIHSIKIKNDCPECDGEGCYLCDGHGAMWVKCTAIPLTVSACHHTETWWYIVPGSY